MLAPILIVFLLLAAVHPNSAHQGSVEKFFLDRLWCLQQKEPSLGA